jgi:hypothetical protein
MAVDIMMESHSAFLDKHLGEKGHCEYSWANSKNIQELLVQLNFQLVRDTNEDKIIQLENIQREILDGLMDQIEQGIISFVDFQELIVLNYKLVAFTRDIICGKGEYTLAYMLVNVWFEYFPELAKFMLKSFVVFDGKHPLGSWKDLKHFCNYCIKCGYKRYYPMIKYAYDLIIEQLKKDVLKTRNEELSLVAKWIPREKSKRFGWIFNELAVLYFNNYIQSTNDFEKHVKAVSKCKTDFRVLVAGLNKRLGTIQIYQCSKEWAKIDYNKITSSTFSKQSKALFNLTQDGTMRYPLNDRIKCSNNAIMHVYEHLGKPHSEIRGKRISVSEFVKRAIELLQNRNSNQNEYDLLNLQWKDFLSQIESLGPMIPMVDLSESMNGEAYYNAIGLACIIASKSAIKQRVMTFSAFSQWHNLEDCPELIDMVRQLMNANCGMNADFYGALDKILNVFVEPDISCDTMNGTTIVVLSDMQIHSLPLTDKKMASFYETIYHKYQSLNKKYKPPHILFWNLRSTAGFPTLSIQYNVSMVSGNNPLILNSLVKKGGFNSHDTCNPWFMLKKQLNISRYNILGETVKKILNK